MWPVVLPLHESGFAVLPIEARCHGHSDGGAFTSMPRLAEDIAAGLTWLKHQPDIVSDNLALLGHAVGAAACLLHASRHNDVRAVVILSAFAHPREIGLRASARGHARIHGRQARALPGGGLVRDAACPAGDRPPLLRYSAGEHHRRRAMPRACGARASRQRGAGG